MDDDKLIKQLIAEGFTDEEIFAALEEEPQAPAKISPERQALIDDQGDRELTGREVAANVLAPILSGVESFADSTSFGLSSALANLINPEVNEAIEGVGSEQALARGAGAVAGSLLPGVAALRGGAAAARGLSKVPGIAKTAGFSGNLAKAVGSDALGALRVGANFIPGFKGAANTIKQLGGSQVLNLLSRTPAALAAATGLGGAVGTGLGVGSIGALGAGAKAATESVVDEDGSVNKLLRSLLN